MPDLVFTGEDVDTRRKQVMRAIRDGVVRVRSDAKPWSHPIYEAIREAYEAAGQDRVHRMEAYGNLDGTRTTLCRLRSSFVLPQGLEMQPLIDMLVQAMQVIECDDLKDLVLEEDRTIRLLGYLEVKA